MPQGPVAARGLVNGRAHKRSAVGGMKRSGRLPEATPSRLPLLIILREESISSFQLMDIRKSYGNKWKLAAEIDKEYGDVCR